MAIISEKIDGVMIDVVVNSTNIKSAKYNTESKNLLVEFNNGSLYQYNDVPWDKFTKFRMSDSQGKYFSTNISKSYSYKKIK